VRLSIATGGTGGVYYPLGGAMANVISKYVPEAEATAEVTAASVDNCLLVGAKKSDMALIMADVGFDAAQGREKFKEKLPLRTLAVLYPNNMHIVTLDGKGIEKMADLKGKRFSTGAPGSGTEPKCLRVLEAAGIDVEKDLKRDRLGASESAGALKDSKIDAYCWDGGIPTASITDLGAPRDEAQTHRPWGCGRENVKKYGPFYVPGIIGQELPRTGEGCDHRRRVERPDLQRRDEEDVAYKIVKTLLKESGAGGGPPGRSGPQAR
jgi:TRAP transporter TAXI family solute receptor